MANINDILVHVRTLYYIHDTPCRILEWTSKSPPTDKQGPVVVVSVPATQAVPMPALNVVLVLSPRGELTVYSGTLKVNHILKTLMIVAVHDKKNNEVLCVQLLVYNLYVYIYIGVLASAHVNFTIATLIIFLRCVL